MEKQAVVRPKWKLQGPLAPPKATESGLHHFMAMLRLHLGTQSPVSQDHVTKITRAG